MTAFKMPELGVSEPIEIANGSLADKAKSLSSDLRERSSAARGMGNRYRKGINTFDLVRASM